MFAALRRDRTFPASQKGAYRLCPLLYYDGNVMVLPRAYRNWNKLSHSLPVYSAWSYEMSRLLFLAVFA